MKRKVVSEQKGDEMMPGQIERFGYRSNKPETLKPAIQKQSETLKDLSNMDIDNLIDVVSAAIDGIPGIGQLVSAGIDIVHAISYMIRFYFSKTDEEKITNGAMSILTLGSTMIPIGGNLANIAIKGELKNILKQTPDEIIKLSKKLGIYNKTIILLRKTKWQYSWVLFLSKLLGKKILDIVPYVILKLNQIKKTLGEKFNNFKPYFENLISLLNEINEYTDVSYQLTKNI